MKSRIGWMIAVAIGLVVMIGWHGDIGVLKSGRTDWVTVKYTTALCIVLSGLSGAALPSFGGRLFSTTLSMCALVTCVYSLGGSRHALFSEADTGVLSSDAGVPSYATAVCVLVVSFYLLMRSESLPGGRLRALSARVAWPACLLISGTALIGYAFGGVPWMLFFVDGVSTAMAFLTAVSIHVIGWQIRSEARA